MKEANEFRDAPSWLVWTMTFINRVGFPVAVSIYLGWLQVKAVPKLTNAIQDINLTMQKVERAVSENTDVIRSLNGPHISRRRRADDNE